MSTPTDRLPYSDCAYIEAALSTEHAGHAPCFANDVAGARALHEAAAPCPVCTGASHTDPLSAEALDVLQLRFWSADHRKFDHLGFARAVLAACAE